MSTPIKTIMGLFFYVEKWHLEQRARKEELTYDIYHIGGELVLI